jgi:DNA-directed RNA polymerase specialized sigma24 family protein
MTLSHTDQSPGARVVPLPTRSRGDAALIQAAAAGDGRAARLLWDRHSPALRSSLRQLLGPECDVEEPLHRVFLLLLRRIERLRDPGMLRVFLIGIAVEVATPRLRREKLGRWLKPKPKGAPLYQQHALLAELPPQERIAFVLHQLEGLQPAEIAEAMQVPLMQVQRDLTRSSQQIVARIRRREDTLEDDRVLLARFQELALGDLDGEISEVQASAGRERLAQSLSREESPRRRPLLMWVLGAAAAAASGVGLVQLSRTMTQSLSYAVDGSAVAAGGYVRGAPGHGSRIQFSDGSAFDLADGARGRIASVHRHGARIALEGGRAHVRVTPGEKASWAVDAGPFVLHLRDTEADLDWSAADEVLELGLHQGSVTISGPPAPGGLVLHAGQRLVAAEGRLQVEPLPVNESAL